MTTKRSKHDPDLDDDTVTGRANVVDLSAYTINVKQDEEDDSDVGGVGVAGLSVEELQAWLAALQTKELRNGEKKFGSVPETRDPNELLGKKGQSSGYDARIKAHKLLSKTQRFSGDDPKLTARASENKQAPEEFMKEQLQNQLRKQHTLTNQARKRTTLTRG